jgi:MFS family permease
LAVAETVVWAAMYYAFPALLPAWEAELGWTKTELSGAFTLALVVSAALAPVAGRLIDSGHGRKAFTGGAVLGALMLALLSQVTALWQFYAIWVGLGVAMSSTLYEACFAVLTLSMGPHAKRAITLVTLAAGFAGTLSFPSAHALAGAFGWRGAVLVFAAAVAVVAVPLIWIGCQRAERHAETHAPQASRRASHALGATRSASFWLLVVAFAMIALDHGAVITHVLPILEDRGVHEEAAVLAASMIGPMQVAGRLAMMAAERHVSTLAIGSASSSSRARASASPASSARWSSPSCSGAGTSAWSRGCLRCPTWAATRPARPSPPWFGKAAATTWCSCSRSWPRSWGSWRCWPRGAPRRQGLATEARKGPGAGAFRKCLDAPPASPPAWFMACGQLDMLSGRSRFTWRSPGKGLRLMTKPDNPTTYTRRAHRDACCEPNFDWEDRQDFESASYGLIHRPEDPAILDADGRVVWHHEAFEDFLHGDAPTTVHPSLWRHALLNNYRGLFKVTDGVYQVRGESLANVTFVESDTGYIVIDPLTTVEVAAYALNLLYEYVGERPIVAVIYSHSHSDHFGGVKGMISDEDVSSGKVRVIASDSFVEWVLKEQGLAAEGMPSRNDYMYGENRTHRHHRNRRRKVNDRWCRSRVHVRAGRSAHRDALLHSQVQNAARSRQLLHVPAQRLHDPRRLPARCHAVGEFRCPIPAVRRDGVLGERA